MGIGIGKPEKKLVQQLVESTCMLKPSSTHAAEHKGTLSQPIQKRMFAQ